MSKFQDLRSWKSNLTFQNVLRAKFWTKNEPIKLFLFILRLLS